MTENPYAAPGPAEPGKNEPLSPEMQARVAEEAKRMLKDKENTSISWQLLITGIFGCFSPIVVIYGLIFLLRRPYPFPYKGIAIAGTVLHCLWTIFLILAIAGNYFAAQSGGAPQW